MIMAGHVRERVRHVGEVGDYPVNAGDREDAEDGGAADDQQQLAAFGLGASVRRHQGMNPRRIAELGPGHVGHERPGPVRGGLEQSRAQVRDIGGVDLLRYRHDRDTVDQLDGEPVVQHLRHLPWP